MGLLIDDLKAAPLVSRKDRVGFRYRIPATTSSFGSPLMLWVNKRSFGFGAKRSRLPSAWTRSYPLLSRSLMERLNDPYKLKVGCFGPSGPFGAVITMEVCHNAPARIRLLDRKKDRIKVAVRLVSAYTGALGPFVLQGWMDLQPGPRWPGIRPLVSKRHCFFLGRSGRRGWSSGNGRAVSTRPLPLYPTADPRGVPVGVLAANAAGARDGSSLVRSNEARFLKVYAQSLPFFVPYHESLFRMRAPRSSL